MPASPEIQEIKATVDLIKETLHEVQKTQAVSGKEREGDREIWRRIELGMSENFTRVGASLIEVFQRHDKMESWRQSLGDVNARFSDINGRLHDIDAWRAAQGETLGAQNLRNRLLDNAASKVFGGVFMLISALIGYWATHQETPRYYASPAVTSAPTINVNPEKP